MKFSRVLTALALSLVLVAPFTAPLGCARPPASVTTPQGTAAFKAASILNAIKALDSVTMVLGDQHAISDADQKIVLTFTLATLKTLKAAPLGAETTIKAGLTSTLAALPPASKTKLAPYFTAALATLAVIEGQ